MNIVTLFIVLASLLIIRVILIVGRIIQERDRLNREKSSVYECGLDPNMSARVPFSLRLFLLAVIFLVFDVEIALLMAVPVRLKIRFGWTALRVALFLLILLFGLIHEWREGSLD